MPTCFSSLPHTLKSIVVQLKSAAFPAEEARANMTVHTITQIPVKNPIPINAQSPALVLLFSWTSQKKTTGRLASSQSIITEVIPLYNSILLPTPSGQHLPGRVAFHAFSKGLHCTKKMINEGKFVIRIKATMGVKSPAPAEINCEDPQTKQADRMSSQDYRDESVGCQTTCHFIARTNCLGSCMR